MDITTKIILIISFIVPITIITIGCLLPEKKYSYSFSTITKKYKILFIRREGYYNNDFYVEYLNENNIISSKTIYRPVMSIGEESQLIEDILITKEIETGEEDTNIIRNYIILTQEDYDKIKDAYVKIGW